MPSLFLFAIVAISIQHILDKLLLTYYFEAKPSHETEMSWRIIRSIKYCVVPFLTLGAYTVKEYYCSAGFYDKSNYYICVQNNKI